MEQPTESFDVIVVAAVAGKDFEKPVIHSLELGTQLEYMANNVERATVVGRSKSSYDIVYHLLSAGKKVDWVTRDGVSGPFSLYAPTFLGLWNMADHVSTRFAPNFSPCIMNTSGFCYDFFQRSLVGRMFANLYWRTANYLSVSHAQFWRTTDMVIYCTGFEKGYSTFDPDLREELGLEYDVTMFSKWTMLDEKAENIVNEALFAEPPRTVWGVRSVLFPGHIHSVFTPLAAELQALWGVTWMLGWRDVPPKEEMELEATTFNAWTRKRYLEQGTKYSYFIYNYIPYIDTLMKDLALNPFRKSNIFEEWFVRYKPHDHRTVLDEYRALRRKQGSVENRGAKPPAAGAQHGNGHVKSLVEKSQAESSIQASGRNGGLEKTA
ncbi:hypothetical protein DL771_008974 [Monosporascus sp. 5C6A]|nr:hypothetical protein DL771_008974 [Monosporascus sp. 5C6A]